MLTTSTLHSPGFWNHMPPGHELHIVMNDGVYAEDPLAEQTLPARRVKSSHVSAWLLVGAVGATGAALAVVNMHNKGTLNEALADVKSLGHHDATPDAAPAATSTTAQTTPGVLPAATPAADEGTKVAQADVPAAPAPSPVATPAPKADTTPMPPIAPAAGRSNSNVNQPKPAPAPAPRQVASLSTSSATQELRDAPVPMSPQAEQLTPVNPVTPITPVQPVTPIVPPVVQPASAPIIIAPPAVQPPASSSSQGQMASTQANSGDTTGQ